MVKEFIPLVCEKITLQHVREDDISNKYIDWLNNPDVVKFSNQRFLTHSLESSLQYLHSFSDSENMYLSIKNNENQRLIGSITAYINLKHRTADMGLMIGDCATWGKGFGLEAWSNLMEYLFNTEKLRKITGGAMRNNQAMIKIFEKSGMHLEATIFKQELLDGVPVDILCYAKFNNV